MPSTTSGTAATVGVALAHLSMASLRAGYPVLAHAQMTECLSLAQERPARGEGAAIFGVVAAMAVAVGEPELAVEFYGACERLLRSAGTVDGSDAEGRARALVRLREALGAERYKDAWSASEATPIPLEFYLSRAIDWLRDAEPRFRASLAPSKMPSDFSSTGDGSAGTTAMLIVGARAGRSSALSRLAVRVWEPLRRFGHGRLPAKARDLLDTDDLVQNTVVRGLGRVEAIQTPRKGGFLAYLRVILINQVRDEIRRVARRPRSQELGEALASTEPSPLEGLLHREAFDRYRRALDRLSARSREAVLLRIERGHSYQEVADAVGCPSANAARMLVTRALRQIAASNKEMNR